MPGKRNSIPICECMVEEVERGDGSWLVLTSDLGYGDANIVMRSVTFRPRGKHCCNLAFDSTCPGPDALAICSIRSSWTIHHASPFPPPPSWLAFRTISSGSCCGGAKPEYTHSVNPGDKASIRGRLTSSCCEDSHIRLLTLTIAHGSASDRYGVSVPFWILGQLFDCKS